MDFNQLSKIIVKTLLGEASGEESRLLEQWRTESKANQQLFQKLSSEFYLKKAIEDKNKELRLREWNKLETRMVKRAKYSIRLNWWKVVAAVFVLGMGGWAMWLSVRPIKQTAYLPLAEQIQTGTSKAIIEVAGGKQFLVTKDSIFNVETQGVQLVNRQDTLNLIQMSAENGGEQQFHVIRIPNGGEYITRLEDGSVIHLNAGSELKVPVHFGVTSRKVWLKGEAFFEVARNEKLPFTVHTEKAAISVLGTQFDVRAYADEKEVVTTLVQGAVQVLSGNRVNHLKPGEQARVVEEGKIVTEKVDVYPFIAWKNGRMVFEDKSLEYIMTELQRWYDFEIFYTGPEVKQIRFTMDILKYDDISNVLNLMKKMNKVNFTQKGRTIVLSSH